MRSAALGRGLRQAAPEIARMLSMSPLDSAWQMVGMEVLAWAWVDARAGLWL